MGPRRTMFVLVALAAFGALFLGASNDSPGPPKEVTFNRDVAPIFFKNCVVCHRPNDIAPMSLMTYKDSRILGTADSGRGGESQDAALACRPQGGRFHQ